jgi:hypothetical protein
METDSQDFDLNVPDWFEVHASRSAVTVIMFGVVGYALIKSFLHRKAS